jgi:hypothetical protein
VPPTDALRPVKLNNACPPRITAAAGTRFAGTFIQVLSCSSLMIEVYDVAFTFTHNHMAMVLHVTLLDQACAHCPIFPTAAFQRSLGRVSVPVWLFILSDQLRIRGLVSLYLTNYLILYGLILHQKHSFTFIRYFHWIVILFL